ncbi:MAG TPA: sporulation membrane protein YtaF [Desulfobacteria bacterium]|nr:sporulation membrane protein YtaF [Desulfobacteria bacterium]
MFWSALVLAVALSLDGFGVGAAYGMRKIKITAGPLMTIALCSMLAMTVSMLAGHGIVRFTGGFKTAALGAIILIAIGLWQIVQGIMSVLHKTDVEEEAIPVFGPSATAVPEHLVFSINLRPVGLAIQVLRTPTVADMDGSGTLNFREALLLGLALNLDAFGAGFGAALAGFPLLIIPGVALCQIAMVSLGRTLSARVIPETVTKRFMFLPGIVIVLIGILRLSA